MLDFAELLHRSGQFLHRGGTKSAEMRSPSLRSSFLCGANCIGPSATRRTFHESKIGGAISLALAQHGLLSNANAGGRQPKKSCVLLWMNGGPSQIDTVDPKTGTASGGSFKAIKTKVRGVEFCEHLPLLAEQADKLAVVRSMTSNEGNHDRGQCLMHTGYAPSVTVKHLSVARGAAMKSPVPIAVSR